MNFVFLPVVFSFDLSFAILSFLFVASKLKRLRLSHCFSLIIVLLLFFLFLSVFCSTRLVSVCVLFHPSSSLPSVEFRDFIRYRRGLKFEQTPDTLICVILWVVLRSGNNFTLDYDLIGRFWRKRKRREREGEGGREGEARKRTTVSVMTCQPRQDSKSDSVIPALSSSQAVSSLPAPSFLLLLPLLNFLLLLLLGAGTASPSRFLPSSPSSPDREL